MNSFHEAACEFVLSELSDYEPAPEHFVVVHLRRRYPMTPEAAQYHVRRALRSLLEERRIRETSAGFLLTKTESKNKNMTKVITDGLVGPKRLMLGALPDNSWFLLDGVAMLKVGYQEQSENDLVVEFRPDEIVTNEWSRGTLVTKIDAPGKAVLRWEAQSLTEE